MITALRSVNCHIENLGKTAYRHAKANRDSHSTMRASISLCLPVLKHIPSPAKDNIIRKINDMFTYAVSNDLTF